MTKNTYIVLLYIIPLLIAVIASSCGDKGQSEANLKGKGTNDSPYYIDTLSGQVGRYFIDLPEEIGVNNRYVLAAVKIGDTISIVFDEGIQEVVKNMTREYQIELNPDGSAWVYDGERLVGKLPYREGESFHDLMSSDNE